jgi:hypothetical protein
MTMHLEGPWLSTTGRIKSKRRKYASASAARKSRELQAEWERRQQEWNQLAPNFSGKKIVTVDKSKTSLSSVYKLAIPPGRETPRYPSRDSGSGVAVKAPDKVYTGTMIKGIGTMHKSNAVPIFSDEEATDIAHMRR